MKKTLLTIIITLAVAVGVVLLANSIWGDGGCIFGDKDKTECSEEEKDDCCDKEVTKSECGDKDVKKSECCDKDHAEKSNGVLCDSYKPVRAEFDTQLSDNEKATISEIKEKFAGIDHTEMCPESEAKFMDEHKADFEALTAIADNHKEYFEEMMASKHENKEKECKHAEGEGHHKDDGEVVKGNECPETHNCKEATEKCKGEKTVEEEKKCEEEVDKKCKEEKKKCKQECMNTFKIHFLLLDFDKA